MLECHVFRLRSPPFEPSPGNNHATIPVHHGGTASIKLPIPNNQSLVDAKAYNQWAVFDLGANAWGLAFSNGGAIKVGK